MLPAFLILVAAALLVPGLLVGPSLDPSVFTEVSGRLLNGQVLYIDVWDHKPPGTYLIYAMVQAALPFVDSWLVVWLLSVGVTASSGLLVSAVARHMGVGKWPRWLAATGTVVLMSQYLTALGGGLTEPLATLPVTGALLLAVGAASHRQLVVIGVLLSATLLISIPLAGAAGAVAGLAMVRGDGRPRGWLARVGLIMFGSTVPAGIVLIWLAAVGALPAAFDALVTYSAAYRGTNQAFGLVLSGPVITWTLLSFLFLIAPAILGFLQAWRDGRARRQLGIAAFSWIGLSLALFAYQGRFFAHYAIPLAVPVGLMAALGLERVATILGSGRSAQTKGLALLPLVVSIVISVAAGVAGARFEWLPVARDHLRSERVSDVIRQTTTPNDSIWVWGNETQLYLLADRPSVTRYSYLYPLVTPGYSTTEQVMSTLRDLETTPPVVIVDAGSRAPGIAGFQQLLVPRPLSSDGRNLDLLSPLRDFVRDRYDEIARVDGWVLYRLRGVEIRSDL